MAQKMSYRRDKTREELDRERDDTYVFDDVFCGSDYLDAVEKGDIKDDDTVVMLSFDGAQLFRNKKSDCWIYVWIILDLAPDERYKIRNIIPGGIIPGPGHPKNIDSFLFPGLSHVSAIQKEGLKIWDAHRRAAFLSFVFVLLVLADAVAMAEASGSVGHHGRKGCRLLCPLVGRNKLGGGHYYPALLKPHGPDNPSSNHNDIPIDSLPPPDPKKYREDLNHVLTSQDESEYKQRRRETGIKKPTIFDGLPRVLEPPTCFPGDIMHQPVINLTALMLDLWCDREGCRKGDPGGIWPWAVLKGEIWKAHGAAVANAASYFLVPSIGRLEILRKNSRAATRLGNSSSTSTVWAPGSSAEYFRKNTTGIIANWLLGSELSISAKSPSRNSSSQTNYTGDKAWCPDPVHHGNTAGTWTKYRS